MNWLTNFVKPKLSSLVKRRSVPEKLWNNCVSCGNMIHHKDLKENLFVCVNCNYHFRMSAEDRIKLFFEKGKKFLKPMVLKDVAKKINMHESTVSRVTSEKLMMTPLGMFEMKVFFSASINSINNGESHSAESVRESLKKIISDEPLESPLSDEMLVNKLKGEGINLARRTVAKYRELLNIPASSVRRKIMKIQNVNI